MPRFSRDRFRPIRGRGLEERLSEMEREYDMEPQREEEDYGVFGPRGFFGNIRDFYGMDSWGGFWRGLFGRDREREEPSYTIYPHWGAQNIRTLRDIMED